MTQYCLRHGYSTTNVAHLWSSFKYDKQINVCKNERPNFKNLTDLNGSVHWRVKDKNVFKKIIIKIKKYLIESKGNMYFSRGDTDKGRTQNSHICRENKGKIKKNLNCKFSYRKEHIKRVCWTRLFPLYFTLTGFLKWHSWLCIFQVLLTQLVFSRSLAQKNNLLWKKTSKIFQKSPRVCL